MLPSTNKVNNKHKNWKDLSEVTAMSCVKIPAESAQWLTIRGEFAQGKNGPKFESFSLWDRADKGKAKATQSKKRQGANLKARKEHSGSLLVLMLQGRVGKSIGKSTLLSLDITL